MAKWANKVDWFVGRRRSYPLWLANVIGGQPCWLYWQLVPLRKHPVQLAGVRARSNRVVDKRKRFAYARLTASGLFSPLSKPAKKWRERGNNPQSPVTWQMISTSTAVALRLAPLCSPPPELLAPLKPLTDEVRVIPLLWLGSLRRSVSG